MYVILPFSTCISPAAATGPSGQKAGVMKLANGLIFGNIYFPVGIHYEDRFVYHAGREGRGSAFGIEPIAVSIVKQSVLDEDLNPRRSTCRGISRGFQNERRTARFDRPDGLCADCCTLTVQQAQRSNWAVPSPAASDVAVRAQESELAGSEGASKLAEAPAVESIRDATVVGRTVVERGTSALRRTAVE